MVLEWYNAFWVYILISIAVFLFFRIFIHKRLANHYGWKKTDGEFAKVLYVLTTPLVLYLLWHNSQTIYLVESKTFAKHKVGIFISSLELKSGTLVSISNVEEIIVNNTENYIVYEVIEYSSQQAIFAEQHSYPKRKSESRAFSKIIRPYSVYDCSKIGVEYFFEDVPPLEKEDEPDLPFGNRDESVWNLYGWIRAKDVDYKRDSTEWR